MGQEPGATRAQRTTATGQCDLRGAHGEPRPVGVDRVLLLRVRAVAEHEGRKVRGRPRAHHGAVEAVPDELRQVSTMIEVGVGEDDSVQTRGVEREILPVASAV